MGWVKKIPYVEPHVCPVPSIVDRWGNNPTVAVGSIWKCDECGQTWEVFEDIRNGLYRWREHEPKRRLRG